MRIQDKDFGRVVRVEVEWDNYYTPRRPVTASVEWSVPMTDHNTPISLTRSVQRQFGLAIKYCLKLRVEIEKRKKARIKKKRKSLMSS